MSLASATPEQMQKFLVKLNQDERSTINADIRGKYYCVCQLLRINRKQDPASYGGLGAILTIEMSNVKLNLILFQNRQTEIFDDDLLLHGYSPKKVKIYDQFKGHIDQIIFEDYAKDILVPEIQRQRIATKYQDSIVLILDSCSAHKGRILTNCMKKIILRLNSFLSMRHIFSKC
jgi:hypothetical protein